MKRLFKRIAIAGVLLIGGLVASGCFFTRSVSFGRLPEGKRLDSIRLSAQYKDGFFQNQHPTLDLTEGVSLWKAIKDNLFHKQEHHTPIGPLPVVKTDLKALPLSENIVVWMGHSSSLLQIEGKRILMDPVLSEAASPLSFINKGYKGTQVFTADDFPEIDVLLISHDHWDHLDYPTVKALQPKIKKVVCGLGTGEHFRRWGYRDDQIEERDWYGKVVIDSILTIVVTPARHNSGRSFTRMKALWASYVIQTPSCKVFFSGDTGYDTHFSDIGKAYGPFDLALMECGQYDKNYKYTHMQPEQSLQAVLDVGAKQMLPIHWAKFTESNHAWNEPIRRISALAAQKNLPLLTPMIGQAVDLDRLPAFIAWWETVL